MYPAVPPVRPWLPPPGPYVPPGPPVWGPPPPGRGTTGVWDPPAPTVHAVPVVCDSCRYRDCGEFCSRCGWALGSSKSVLRLTAESFFKFDAIRRWARLYRTILTSPVAETLEGFERGRLTDAVRFFELSAALYFLCLAASGGAVMFGQNEFLRSVETALFPFVVWGTTYALYYQWMRRISARPRSSQEYVKFLCLTQGFVLAPSGAFMLGPVGAVVALLLLVPMYVYLARTWAWFWDTSWVVCGLVLLPCSVVGGLAGVLALTPALLGL